LTYDTSLLIFDIPLLYSTITNIDASDPEVTLQGSEVNGSIIPVLSGDYSNIGFSEVNDLRSIYDDCVNDESCVVNAFQSSDGFWSLIIRVGDIYLTIFFDDSTQTYYLCNSNSTSSEDAQEICEDALDGIEDDTEPGEVNEVNPRIVRYLDEASLQSISEGYDDLYYYFNFTCVTSLLDYIDVSLGSNILRNYWLDYYVEGTTDLVSACHAFNDTVLRTYVFDSVNYDHSFDISLTVNESLISLYTPVVNETGEPEPGITNYNITFNMSGVEVLFGDYDFLVTFFINFLTESGMAGEGGIDPADVTIEDIIMIFQYIYLTCPVTPEDPVCLTFAGSYDYGDWWAYSNFLETDYGIMYLNDILQEFYYCQNSDPELVRYVCEWAIDNIP
jgi:hypothetical protein